MNPGRILLAFALAILPAAGTSLADEPQLGNDDLCGTSLIGGEGSQGRSDEAWNRRLEEFFRSGGGLTLRNGKIEHEGPAGGAAVAWLGTPVAASGEDAWNPSDHLVVTRYEVRGSTVLQVTARQTPSVSSTVFAWFAQGDPEAHLAGAALLVSNDAGEHDDNGYFVRRWNEAASGSVTLEPRRWPSATGPRLAIDVVYKSRHVGVAGEMHTLVAVNRVPEGDPTRIGRFLRDAGIVRAPCLHQDLDPDVLSQARREMERDEALAVIRAAADFVVMDAAHAVRRESLPASRAEVRCPGGRTVAEISLYTDEAGVARQLVTKTTRVKSVDDAVYSYDAEGRLRFLRMESKPRNSGAPGLLEVWYDEAGNESGSKSDGEIVRPRAGTDPSAEVAWVKDHEAELKKVCEPGW